MPRFQITWVLDLDADSPEDAAVKALEVQRDRFSHATVFHVADLDTEQAEQIDLSDVLETSLVHD